MRTISIINQKGGCGKTTTAINLAGLLARAGKRTLLVDMDPQSHCAAGLGVPEQRIDMDIGDAMLAVGQRNIDPSRLLWRAGRNLDLAPSRMRLAGLEAARGGLAEMPDKDRRLTKVLDAFRAEYDIAVIDCSPSIGLLTFNALFASGTVLIPVETSFFSLQGATKQVNTIRTLSRRMGTTLPVWILPTIHDEASSVAGDLLAELQRRFKDRLVPVVIRRDPRLKEAASFGQTICDYAPGSTGAEDYSKLALWVADHLDHLPADVLAAPSASSPADAQDPALIEVIPHQPDELAPRRSEAVTDMVATIAAAPTPTEIHETRAVSRAEDVARRAQQFLRRAASAPAGITESEIATLAAPSMAHPTLRLMESERLPPPALSIATQRLLGARSTSQGVLFVQPISVGGSVAIAGEFNNWSPTTHPMRRNNALGVYELCFRLPAGRIKYRLVIDGQWTADPYNDVTELNPFGEPDSIVVVPAEKTQ